MQELHNLILQFKQTILPIRIVTFNLNFVLIKTNFLTF